MPKGPLGINRLTSIGPFVNLTTADKVQEQLDQYVTEIDHTGGMKDEFAFVLDIKTGDDSGASAIVQEAIPEQQSVPSRLVVSGNTSEGTIRLPKTSGTYISGINLKQELKSITPARVNINLNPSGNYYMPVVEIDNAGIQAYIDSVESLYHEYAAVVVGEGYA